MVTDHGVAFAAPNQPPVHRDGDDERHDACDREAVQNTQFVTPASIAPGITAVHR